MDKKILLGSIITTVMLLLPTVIAEESITSNNVIKVEEEEPKEFLFKTIIEIADNPRVKDLFEHTDNKLRKPSVLKSTLFTNPRLITIYLNFVYENGCKIVNILGEEDVLYMVELLKITNSEFIDELTDIITNNPELNAKVTKLAILNSKLKPDSPFEGYPIICGILKTIMVPIGLIWYFYLYLCTMFQDNSILFSLLVIFGFPIDVSFIGLLLLLYGFDCIDFPPQP